MKKRSFVFVILPFFFLAVSLTASATLMVPITGTAVVNSFTDGYSFSGPGLSLFAGEPGGTDSPEFCTSGAHCALSVYNGLPPTIPGYSGGSIDGVTAQYLIGPLVFALSPQFSFIPVGYNVQGPVTFFGMISGYSIIPTGGGGALGPLQFTAYVSGSGTLTAYEPAPGQYAEFNYTFSGTLISPAPEPSRLLLASICLGTVGLWTFRKRGVAHPGS